MADTPQTLVLIPTDIERSHLAACPGFGVDRPHELCGFGPVAAAARTAALIARDRPDRILLLGIAGTFDRERLPIGTAATFGRVVMHGVGVGTGAAFVPAGAVGFPQWPDDDEGVRVDHELPLSSPVPTAAGSLLTCCAASISNDDASQRVERFPGVVAEDMEGFAVALAGRLALIPVAVIRGISNQAGDRRVDRWQIPDALDAAWQEASDVLTRPDWTR